MSVGFGLFAVAELFTVISSATALAAAAADAVTS